MRMTGSSERQDVNTIDSGALDLTPINESMGAAFPPESLFPDFSPHVFAEAPLVGTMPYYGAEKGKLVSSIHGWTFRLDGKLVLVDTGRGRHQDKGLANAPFFMSLAAAGIAPSDIDMVLLTHLHTDHIKNNTHCIDGRWEPAFRNARYVVGRREYAHWQADGAGLALYPEQASILREAITPIVEAGQLDLIDDDAEVLPGLRAMQVPGHTATQLAFILENGPDTFLFAADSFHHPLQVYRPDWGSSLCEDRATAYRTRMSLLDFCASRNAVLLASHFGGTHAGLIHRRGEGYGFEPIAILARRSLHSKQEVESAGVSHHTA